MKKLDGDRITHVMQTEDDNCVTACLAMVTDNDINDVEEYMYKQFDSYPPHMPGATLAYLVHNKIYAEKCDHSIVTPMFSGVYLISVCSLNKLGQLHAVVGIFEETSMTILDPNKGKLGKKFYDEDSWTEMAWSELFYLWDASSNVPSQC